MVVFSFPFLFFFFFYSPRGNSKKKTKKEKKNTHTTTNCMTTTLVGSRMLWMPVSVITDCKTANTNNLLELQQKPKNFFFLSLEKKINEKEFFLGHIFSIICCSHCDFSASMIKVLYWYSFEHPYNQRLSFFLFFNQRRKKNTCE